MILGVSCSLFFKFGRFKHQVLRIPYPTRERTPAKALAPSEVPPHKAVPGTIARPSKMIFVTEAHLPQKVDSKLLGVGFAKTTTHKLITCLSIPEIRALQADKSRILEAFEDQQKVCLRLQEKVEAQRSRYEIRTP